MSAAVVVRGKARRGACVHTLRDGGEAGIDVLLGEAVDVLLRRFIRMFNVRRQVLQRAVPARITAPVHVGVESESSMMTTRLGRRSGQESQLGRASLRRRIELKTVDRACVLSPRVVLRHDDACSGMTEHAAKSFGVHRVARVPSRRPHIHSVQAWNGPYLFQPPLVTITIIGRH